VPEITDTVWLPRALIRRMLEATTSAGERETGGMLVGYEGADRPELVVTDLIEAGPRARRDEYEFHPDGRWQRRELARVYHESGRVVTFLGDWHSHPHGLPLPSDTDVETAARTAANERARAPRPLTLIVGRDEDEWLLVAFRYAAGELVPAQLRVFDRDDGDLFAALDVRTRVKKRWRGARSRGGDIDRVR
jgi:integrative and conjugative element protein (TIGR02256 family)